MMAPAVANSTMSVMLTLSDVQARYAAGGTITSEGNGMNELSTTIRANTSR
jgi:hypothetical protein